MGCFLVAYSSGNELHTRSDIAGKPHTELFSSGHADVLSQDAKEVDKWEPAKEQPPPPANGREGKATFRGESPSPTSTREGGGNDTVERSSTSPTRAKEAKDTTKKPTYLTGNGEGKSTAEKHTTLPTSTFQLVQQNKHDNTEPLAPPLSWEEILENKLALHKTKRNSVIDEDAPYQTEDYNGMTLENVLSAVATIWEALRVQGMTYAFAGNDVLDTEFREVVRTSKFRGLGVVGKNETRFIMPMFFSAAEKDIKEYHEGLREKRTSRKEAKTEKEKKAADNICVREPFGHILLAIAEKDPAKPERVHIEIRDSRPGTTHSTVIRDRAKEAAATWLGMDVDAIFTDVNVVRQPKTIHTCGLFTILNAWAVMLGIPLLKGEQRRKKRQNTVFLDAALEVVNLALAGFMDSKTIQAFLNVYGYSEAQGVDSETTYTVEAVRMSYEELECKLQEEKTKCDEPHSKSSTNFVHSSDSAGLRKAVSNSKAQHFMELVSGVTLEQAEDFLKTASGDLDKAVIEFTKCRSSVNDGSAGAKGF